MTIFKERRADTGLDMRANPRYVKFVDSFPTTVNGKIQKYKMREISIRELGLEEAAMIATA